MPAQAADQICQAFLNTTVVKVDPLDRITLAKLPLTRHKAPLGPAGDRTERVVIVLESAKDLGRSPAGKILHHGPSATAVHPANADAGVRTDV